jgi:hypothetical protein
LPQDLKIPRALKYKGLLTPNFISKNFPFSPIKIIKLKDKQSNLFLGTYLSGEKATYFSSFFVGINF